jgi:thioredoxin
MAVTKNISVERILSILKHYDITLIGENRWQEAKGKLPFLPTNIEKHFIGHLQTNKAKPVVEAFDVIETVDTLNLAQAINQAASELKRIMPVFLQVNISRDSNKYGFLLEQLPHIIPQFEQFQHLQLSGLMTITAKQSPEQTRQDFKTMKQLQIQYKLPELSMGMSDDWSIAVAEGATIVRLGRALYTASMAQAFTDANFKQEVLQSDVPVLVDFWASWCGPCKLLGPLIEELAEEYKGKAVKIGKMEVDENESTPAQYQVMSVPTLIFFQNGKPVQQMIGMQTKADLKAALDGLI